MNNLLISVVFRVPERLQKSFDGKRYITRTQRVTDSWRDPARVETAINDLITESENLGLEPISHSITCLKN